MACFEEVQPWQRKLYDSGLTLRAKNGFSIQHLALKSRPSSPPAACVRQKTLPTGPNCVAEKVFSRFFPTGAYFHPIKFLVMGEETVAVDERQESVRDCTSTNSADTLTHHLLVK